MLSSARILELNPRHPLIDRLAAGQANPPAGRDAALTGQRTTRTEEAVAAGEPGVEAPTVEPTTSDAPTSGEPVATEEHAGTAEIRAIAELLHDMALLAEGKTPDDPGRFVRAVADRLAGTT